MIIPKGNTKEELKLREEIISQAYREWTTANPDKKVFNSSLNNYIHIRFLSITETMRHAAKNHISTLAMLQLDTILKQAVKFGKPTPTKKGVKNQEKFTKMQQMRCECELTGVGVVKMIVGFKRSGEIIQYCITATETQKKEIDRSAL